MTLLTQVTSFASMILNAGRMRTIQDETGRQYIGEAVYETQPNGSKLEATIAEIDWQPTIGLHGDWIIRILYVNHPAGIVGTWCGRDVLTLKESQS